MPDELRRSGIQVIGDIPWGTHFCQFYQTKQDLIDTLVPYFKAGLERNEFCMWITAYPLSADEARREIAKAVPGFQQYVDKGQIEILPHTEWYLKGGSFDHQRVLNGWVSRLDGGLARGFDGLRLTGNTFWLEREGWKDFADYEGAVNSIIGRYKIVALCTYCLEKCSAAEVLDVVRNHQFALIKQAGEWQLIESAIYKQATVALKESEGKYRGLFESSLDGIISVDMSGNIGEANKAMLDMLGYSMDELRVLTYQQITPEKWHGVDDSVVNNQLLVRGYSDEWEKEYIRKDGTTFPISVRAWLIKDDSGNPVGMWGIIRDITHRKEADNKLRQAADQWGATFDSITDMISIHDREFRVIRANKAFVDSVGKRPEDVVGKYCYEIVHGTGSAITGCPHVETLQSDRTAAAEVFEPRLGKYLEVTTSPVREKGVVVGSVHIARDITERKKVEEEIRGLNENLRRRNAELEAANKELEAFSYSVSHDLRAPLRNVAGFAQAVLEDYNDRLDDQGKFYLRRIDAGCQLMGALIDDILKLSRVSRAEMRWDDVNLSELAGAMARKFRINRPEREVEFVIHPGVIASGDSQLLPLVLENLLSNACKFTAKRGSARIEFGVTEQDGHKVYYVRDNGVGFEMTYAGKLFTPFQRLHSSEDFPGTGIGLAIVQRVVRRHGGRVWAEGSVDKGATFYFTLG